MSLEYVDIEQRVIHISNSSRFIILVALLVILFSIVILSTSAAPDLKTLGPIRILDDTEFNSTNGVVSGGGTPADPYIIEGWVIKTASQRPIEIRDTSSHFIIRNVTIDGPDERGINLRSVDNAALYDIAFNTTNGGIALGYTKDILVRNISIPKGGSISCSFGDRIEIHDVFLEDAGFYFSSIDDLVVVRCNSSSTVKGILIQASNDVEVTDCNASYNEMGLRINNAHFVTVRNCTFIGNTWLDIDISRYSTNCTITGCTMGKRGVYLLPQGDHYLDDKNTVDGKPLHFHMNEADERIDSNAGQIILIGCRNFTISNLTFDSFVTPIMLYKTSDCTFTNLTLVSDYEAVAVWNGGTLRFKDISIAHNLSVSHVYAMLFEEVAGVSMVNVTIEGEFEDGIRIHYERSGLSPEASIILDNITIDDMSYNGIYIENSENLDVRVTSCKVSECSYGIRVHLCNSLELRDCRVYNCTRGIDVSGSDPEESSFVLNNRIINCDQGLKAAVCGEHPVEANYIEGSSIIGAVAMGMKYPFSNNTVVKCNIGISYLGYGNFLEDNVIKDCVWGIELKQGTGTVHRNRIDNCSEAGIYGWSISPDFMNTVTDCVITNSTVGIKLATFLRGFEVTRCLIVGCGIGLSQPSGGSLLEVTNCTFEDCSGYAIAVKGSYSSKFYYNNFIRCNYDELVGYHGIQVQDLGGTNSEWDNGALGNYWVDYLDYHPNAIRRGRVYSIPFVVNETAGFQDNYPLALIVDLNPPIADAGPDLTVDMNTTVMLDGSRSTDDIGVVNWTWEIVLDAHSTFIFGKYANYTFERAATYQVGLAVMDAWGNIGYASIGVTVLDTQPPTAISGPDITVDMRRSFSLESLDSWDNVGVVSYAWTIDPGGLAIVLVGNPVSYTLDTPGDFTVMLNVTDAAGNWATDTLTLHVKDVVHPIAEAGENQEVDQGTEVTLDGSASSDNVGIVSWRWTFEYDGTEVVLEGEQTTFVFDIPGEYIVSLFVEDGAGLVMGDIMMLTVNDTEPPITRPGNDIVVPQEELVVLDGRDSSDNVGIANFVWIIEYPGRHVRKPGVRIECTFYDPGIYPVTLEVTDTSGNIGSGTINVTVIDITPPIAIAGGDIVVDEDSSVTLDGLSSFDNVGVTGWTWSLIDTGEDVTLEGSKVEYTFTGPGVYLVTLTVTDAAGNLDTDEFEITVLDIEPPKVSAGQDRTVLQGSTLQFDGTASEDNTGISSWSWNFQYDGAPMTLDGDRREFTFDLPGEYAITLYVTDAAGNVGTGHLNVTVLPLDVALHIGPFAKKNQRPVKGIEVTITLNGTVYEGTSGEDGWAHIVVSRFDLGRTAHVRALKKDWKPLEFDLGTNEDGSLDGNVPPMSRKEGSPGPGLVLAMMAMVAAGLVRWHRLGREGLR